MAADHGPTLEHPQVHGDGSRTPVPSGRRTMPAGRVLIVMLVALVVWALLYAPSLKRASEAQPSAPDARCRCGCSARSPRSARRCSFERPPTGSRAPWAATPRRHPAGGRRARSDDIPTIGPSASVPPPPDEPVEKDTKIRRPTPRDELRVVVVGDSLAAGLGTYLEREFRPALVRVSRQGRISTGLSRLDYFDWMTAMRQIEQLPARPRGRDDRRQRQPEPEGPGGGTVAEIGSFEWPKGYEKRVEVHAHRRRRRRPRVLGRPADRREEGALAGDAAPERHLRARGRRDPQRPVRRHVGPVRHARRRLHAVHWSTARSRWSAPPTAALHARGYELVAEAVGDAAVEEFGLPPTALAD